MFTVNEFNKKFDLLLNNSLSLIKTKLNDRLASNVFRKRDKSRKLKDNKNLKRFIISVRVLNYT